MIVKVFKKIGWIIFLAVGTLIGFTLKQGELNER